jgi:transcriptional antiterminator RfaH
MIPQWFLAQVKPNADQRARRNLERQHFMTFQPLERRTRLRGGKFTTVLSPFFPGYLFISYPESPAPWSLVNSTYGVTRLVSFAGKPAPVPAPIIVALQAACGPDGVVTRAYELAPGSRVEVVSGAFTHFIGEVERLTPDHRVLILLDFIGKQTRVNLQAADLRPVAPPAHARKRTAAQ